MSFHTIVNKTQKRKEISDDVPLDLSIRLNLHFGAVTKALRGTKANPKVDDCRCRRFLIFFHFLF